VKLITLLYVILQLPERQI